VTNSEDAAAGGRAAFPRTRWSLVEQLHDGGAGGERALGELCSMYWYPVYAFVRRDGASPADAEDLTQGFFAQILEKQFLEGADSAKGKLRTYLLTALKRYSINQYRSGARLKRGGGVVVVPLDADEAEDRFRDEPAELDDPEILFERHWALSLLDEAFRATETEYLEAGKAELFAKIHPFLAGRDASDPRYAEIGEQLGMSSGAIQVAVHRVRKRYRRQLEEAVGQTVEDPEDVESELSHVLKILSSG
jgi:RNA polymerase sigma-70 factor (ECF subfamily)